MMILGLRSLTALVMLGAPALASDFYVDAVNGNDANTGTSPASAWKTLTFASGAATPGSGTTIHVAPGTYSPGTGETFPLIFDFQWLRSDAGAATTIIDGGGFSGAILPTNFPRGSGSPSGVTGISGFTLQNANTAIDVTASWSSLDVTVTDCTIRQTFTSGIHADTQSFGFAGGVVHLHVANTTFESTPLGIDLRASFLTGTLDATDCSFLLCSQSGLSVFTGSDPHFGGEQHFTLTRCRFDNNSAGVTGQCTNFGSWVGTLEDCVLVHNGNGLVATAPNGLGNSYRANFVRSTIADSFGTGILIADGSGPQTQGFASFESTLVNGNSPDINVSHVTTNNYSQIGGPDPLFVDRVHGIYRLQFGSPCIDAGDPATNVGTLDVARVARSIDGDLDTVERADIGAYEFTPLRLVTSGKIGTPLRLESSGPVGGTSTIYFMRGGPFAPMATPFGQFDLNPSAFGTLLHTNVAPFPPVAFQRPIPNLAYLVGHTFSFQGLTTSSFAPQGSAYTNVVSVTILP